ncbi:glycosyltransferase family 9 protein [Vibrio sp. 10N.261.46.E12]|uniref:glycosyltransferase family 9 protein n=1 Tax=unclassified Vibrio TaxID=2614977 RepID=UPI000975DD08|nr:MULTISPECIES: glycosyltransferase family 9 protein [unclassified Vibrio]OMO38376.1 ADP-heptose--LPS heptosyltransferase [Vibrio sp. 10N.261.45.E1]PMJ26067.1 ADP-heptose--LPS heptosyltransferase [Vibrio sp. 10N.286.45.B6]PML89620.1 ADP-heptose--LPS heptosyltransferase [Vibrio sp. 10N.261.49.E11]PMM69712.1 ADP-heptose--LPS heptosyltransferase [Vibrio sp. 10N.261.46.F12]PMM90690.1 ADP-heptose--LPS heptosyltransferase [Vibrio sp. 10N.261.46.E8]
MKKLLVIRNDKIGDFMLAWPSFAMLKSSMPCCHITALVPSYTVALAKLCPWIDEVMIDPTEKAGKSEQKQLISDIKAQQFDASISLFSTTYNALLVWKARIPYRLAPATKLAQIFYNHRIKQKRSQSAKPEFEYNLDLVRAFLNDAGESIIEPEAPFLSFNYEELELQKLKLAKQFELNQSKPWVFLHAGSGGSANNLSLQQYTELSVGLERDVEFVLTAGPGEQEKAKELQLLLTQHSVHSVVYDKNDGLVDFARSIACADLFIAGSTGPLHIAAAIDVPTVGFFPSKRSATPLRWKPINSEGRHLAFCPPQTGDKASQDDMSRIEIATLVGEFNQWIEKILVN